jgi:hypothetical protein
MTMLKNCEAELPPDLQLVLIYNAKTDRFDIGQLHEGHWYDQHGDAYHNIDTWIKFTHWHELPDTYAISLKRKEDV